MKKSQLSQTEFYAQFQEGNVSMLSSSHSNIFSLSNGLTIGRTANRNIMLQNASSDILTTQDIILNEGDALSENLMEEILKCVSNSNLWAL